jgi:hypothetical protein
MALNSTFKTLKGLREAKDLTGMGIPANAP